MTDEELTAIRTRLEIYKGIETLGTDEEWREVASVYYEDVPALLAEIERLRSALESIRTRWELADSGEGWPAHSGSLAHSMWDDARQALRDTSE